MSRFLDDIIVKPLPNGRDWQVQHEIRYVTKLGRVIYIPAGFITDFASIPKFFRWLFQPATGKHRRAAVVHDWIYRTPTEDYTKAAGDTIFLEIMELDGVEEWKQTMLYQAVANFGGSSFKARTTVGA